MSKKLRMTALLAVLMVILVLAIGLVACNPKTNTYKVTTQFNAEQGDVVLAPEAKDGNYEEGTMVTVSVTAKSGYEFDALTVNTDENAALNNEGKYIFKVTADTQITVLFRSVGPAACEHKNLSALVAGKAATCMEAGVIAHYHCNDCGKDLAEDKTTILESTVINIDPTAHKYGAMQDLQPATCSATGIKAHKDCELCHKHFDADGNEIPEAELTLAIDSTAHNFGTLINGTPATCSAKGEKAHYHCSLCNKDIAEDKATILDSIEINIDPTAHKYGEMQQQKDATCGAVGIKAHKDCELCHKHFSEQNVEIPDNELTIPATGKHTYDKLVNGGEQGHEVHCSVCDAKQSETLTPHTYGTEYVQDGVQGHHQECACGYHTEIEKHDNGKNPYTDYEGETHSFECEKCGRKVTDEHSMGAWQIDGEGKHYRACVCGKETAHGEHTFGESPVYTDSKDGKHHTVKCIVCETIVSQNHQTKLVSDDASGHHTECELCDYKTATTTHNLKYKEEMSNNYDGGMQPTPKSFHYQYCADECGYEDSANKQACQFKDKYNTEEHWSQCSVCEYENKHIKHSIGKKYDANQHWQQCSGCEYIQGEKSPHNYDGQYKEIPGQENFLHCIPCLTCGYVGHEQGSHTYSDGKYQPTPDDEKNTHQQICDKCNHLNASKEQHEWDEETHTTDDGQWEYHICTKCQAESEKTPSKTHTHTSADGKWFVEGGQHYQICKDDSERFNQHDPKYTLNDDWYEGDGKCEEEGCTISVYTVTDGALTGYTGNFTKIKLPASVFDNTTGATSSITAIGISGASTSTSGIFSKATFTHMSLAVSIITINPYAFYQAELEEIDLSHVITIGTNAFYQCAKLKTVDLSMCETLGEKAFMKCTVLSKVTLRSVGKSAFTGSSSLETIIFTENFNNEWSYTNTFQNCTGIKTIVFEGSTMPKVPASVFNSKITGLTVYYKFKKEVYDENQITDTVLKGANKKFYYATKPSDDPALRDTVSDDEAWYYDSNGEIKLWSEEG